MSPRTGVAAAAMLLGACVAFRPEAQAVRQAAFDHRCPEDQVKALRSGPGGRSWELEVCGESRRYQNLGRPGHYSTWVDVTGGPAGTAPAPPGGAPGGR